MPTTARRPDGGRVDTDHTTLAVTPTLLRDHSTPPYPPSPSRTGATTGDVR